MKMRRDQETGLLVPERERIWTPHRDRQNQLVGAPFFSSPPIPATLKGLWHMDGANDSLVITDSSPWAHVATAGHDAAKISTNQSKFGGSSLRIQRAGNNNNKGITAIPQVAAPGAFPGSNAGAPTGDLFNVDFWVYIVNIPGISSSQYTFFMESGVASFVIYLERTDSPTTYHVKMGVGGETPFAETSTKTALTPATWYHIGASSDGTTFRRFTNGILSHSVAGHFHSASSANGRLNFGGNFQSQTTPDGTDYYLDEIRLFWGECIYTSNFLPPVSPYVY